MSFQSSIEPSSVCVPWEITKMTLGRKGLESEKFSLQCSIIVLKACVSLRFLANGFRKLDKGPKNVCFFAFLGMSSSKFKNLQVGMTMLNAGNSSFKMHFSAIQVLFGF